MLALVYARAPFKAFSQATLQKKPDKPASFFQPQLLKLWFSVEQLSFFSSSRVGKFAI